MDSKNVLISHSKQMVTDQQLFCCYLVELPVILTGAVHLISEISVHVYNDQLPLSWVTVVSLTDTIKLEVLSY